MRVLIAIGGSAASEAAINQVINQVKTKGTEIRLLHVLDPYPERLAKRIGGCDTPDFVAAVQKQRTLASELLQHASVVLRSAGFPVSFSIQEGDIRALILEEAKAWRADLIILGSHDRKGVWHFFSGTISEDVARDAPCSVEVVRVPRWTRYDQVLSSEVDVFDAARGALTMGYPRQAAQS